MNEKIIQAIRQFRDERNWKQYHNSKDLAISISLEAAELLEIFQWSGNDLECEDKLGKFREELADILIYTILLADTKGLDIEEIILEKIKKNIEKYPVNNNFTKQQQNQEQTYKKNIIRRKIFFVFQGNTFEKEYRGGYIWAPISDKNGQQPHHWTRLLDVCKGDIILHGCNGYIEAISVAREACFECKQPAELIAEGLWENEGRRVDCDYVKIKKPVKTSTFVGDIIRLNSAKYSPFNKNGNGNMGYLFEINRELAKIFIKASVQKNPYLASFDYIAAILLESEDS